MGVVATGYYTTVGGGSGEMFNCVSADTVTGSSPALEATAD